MITTYKIPYRDGELRIGWASWDDGTLKARSIKYAYPDSSGKISRGSPELPFDILIDMVLLAAEQGEVKFGDTAAAKKKVAELEIADLDNEAKRLKSALLILQKLGKDLPWANVGPLYDQIGERYELIKDEFEVRLEQGKKTQR